MKKLLTIFIITLAFNIFCWDEVNNGGGAAEGTITYAYLNVEKHIDLCLAGNICHLNQKETEMITRIKNSLSEEYLTEEPLKFISEKNEPGTFIIDGEVKIAKTGNEIGSPIYFNTDLLYFKNNLGIFESISFERAISLVIHELGHHQKNNNHSFLDALGAKISMGSNKYMEISSFFTFSDKLQVIVLNEKKEDSFPQIILRVYDDLIDISEEFKKKLKCNVVAIPSFLDIIPNISISKGTPKGSIFHNVHWTESTKIDKLFRCESDDPETCFHSDKTKRTNFYIKGNLSNICGKESSFFVGNKNYRARIKFSTYVYKDKNDRIKFKYKEDSVRVKQLFEPWWKIISLNLINY